MFDPAAPADPDRDQQRIIAQLNRAKLTVFDIGANKGQSYRKYRRLFPGAQIYCFEPFPEALAELRAKTKGDPRARVVDQAMSDTPGQQTFHVNGQNPTNSLLPRPSDARRYYPAGAGPVSTITVQTTTIDAFVGSEFIFDVDIIKLDVQGAELMVLRGADGVLKGGGVSMILAEAMFVPHYQDQPLLKDIWQFLEPYGYTLFNIYGLRNAANGQLRFGDALFISDSVRRNVIDPGDEEG